MIQILLAIIYLAFISLGLPDSVLGAAWPNMYGELGVPLSYAGIISAVISAGTVSSSLLSDRLNARLGTGKVTAISVAMTAAALFGFSVSHSFPELVFWALPYGLGAGSVDAALNNYVALHYESRHMSWLHCMWGVGAATGPYIMGYALTGGMGWNKGYRIISVLQICLAAVLFATLPLWKKEGKVQKETGTKHRPLTLPEVLRIRGTKEAIVCFFCYCGIETTTGLWASSYLNLVRGIPAETAAGYASMFYLGITAGRALSGFLTMKLSDLKMIRLGMVCILLGIVILFLPLGAAASLTGLVIVGLGCAPVFPCLIHSTPAHFGEARSQSVIGIQMASAYVGCLCIPPLFGIIANRISISLFPWHLLLMLALMTVMHETLDRKTGRDN